MIPKLFFSSVTRISDLTDRSFEMRPHATERWDTGDFVVAEVMRVPHSNSRIEVQTGRMAAVGEGDQIVGALGRRYATLEAVGDWRAVGEDNLMHVLTGGGVCGRVTSWSNISPPLISTRYCGHVTIDDHKVTMSDYVVQLPERELTAPVILVVGTSMSAGKTTTAKTLVRLLKEMDLRVVGAKLTGAGRYRDVLAMMDAGADAIYDFVDVGLPTSVVPPNVYEPALRQLLTRVAMAEPDVVVAEAGASPLEPYNGGLAVELIQSNLRFTVLCASDPYAVVGIRQAFGGPADVVAGPATNTEAGVELVEKLSGLPAINVTLRRTQSKLQLMLRESLEL
jgi:hypothetical protein